MIYESFVMERVLFPVALQNLANDIPDTPVDEKTAQNLGTRLDRLVLDLSHSAVSEDISYAMRILTLTKVILRQGARTNVAKNQLLCLFNVCLASSILNEALVFQPTNMINPTPKEAMKALDEAYMEAVREGQDMKISPLAWQTLREHWEKARSNPKPNMERLLIAAKKLAKEGNNRYMTQIIECLVRHIEDLEMSLESPPPPQDDSKSFSMDSLSHSGTSGLLFDSRQNKSS